MEHVVYWIKNEECLNILTDGYVGVTKNPSVRFKSHLKHNEKIPKNARIEIVFSGTRAECFAEEKRLRPVKAIGWNRAPGGQQGFKDGFIHSEKTKLKLKAAWTEDRKARAAIFKAEQNHKLLGQKRPRQSIAMQGSKNPMFGKTHSNETRLKIGRASLGMAPPNKQEFYCIGCKQRASIHVIKNRHIKCFRIFTGQKSYSTPHSKD